MTPTARSAQAAAWFRQAAQRGFARAQYNLGVLYANGDGVPRDASQAAQWFRQAANQEDPKAQYNLGLLYAEGVGVSQDYGEAYVWFTLAALGMSSKADHSQAIRTPAHLSAAQARVRDWQPAPTTSAGDAPAPALSPSPPSTPAVSRMQQVQARLKAAGFDPGTPDGTLGPKTRDALRRYQRTRGLPATGELDDKSPGGTLACNAGLACRRACTWMPTRQGAAYHKRDKRRSDVCETANTSCSGSYSACCS